MTILNAREQALAFLAQLHERGVVAPIASGIPGLDTVLDGGFRAGVNVLGGITGAGKTAFALQLSLARAKAGPALYFTAEQRAEELLARLLAAEAGYPVHALVDGDPVVIAAAHEALDHLPFSQLYFVRDPREPAGSLVTLRRVVREVADAVGTGPFVVVDYLQRLSSPRSIREDIRVGVVRLSEGITSLVRELDLTGFVLSSLNRASYREVPTLNAFKESGSIEYDADLAMILRPPLPKHDDENGMQGGANLDSPYRELWVLKARIGNAPSDPVRLCFDGRMGRFSSAPDDGPRPPRPRRSRQGRLSVDDVVIALKLDGGEWSSLQDAAEALGRPVLEVGQVLSRAKASGLVHEVKEPGARRRFLLADSSELS